jgi:pimeloyl-ACP methyl ester carboxylesterase
VVSLQAFLSRVVYTSQAVSHWSGRTELTRTQRRTKVTEGYTTDWRLGKQERTSAGEVAYEVFGEGPPVILVHGTPMRSYLWRNVGSALAERHSVYVYDLLGYGESEKGEGQDVSIVAQARLLGELIEAWGLHARSRWSRYRWRYRASSTPP